MSERIRRILKGREAQSDPIGPNYFNSRMPTKGEESPSALRCNCIFYQHTVPPLGRSSNLGQPGARPLDAVLKPMRRDLIVDPVFRLNLAREIGFDLFLAPENLPSTGLGILLDQITLILTHGDSPS